MDATIAELMAIRRRLFGEGNASLENSPAICIEKVCEKTRIKVLSMPITLRQTIKHG